MAIYSGDVARYLVQNSMSGFDGRQDLITVTGPGAERLPWDREKCSHGPRVRCSGKLGCVAQADALREWHRDFWDRFGAMWAAARSWLYRRGHKMPRYLRMAELQDRGVLHLHIATAVPDRAAAKLLADRLAVIAPSYGFGSQVSWDPWRGDDRHGRGGAGGYLAKVAGYMAKGGAPELLEVLRVSPRRRIFTCSASVTKTTRCTMRNLRLVRAMYVRHGATMPCDVAEWTHSREQARMRQRRERERDFLRELHRVFAGVTCERPPPSP